MAKCFSFGAINHVNTYKYALKLSEVKLLYEERKKRPLTSLIRELIEAAEPFLSPDVVDETTGTIPLMIRLEYAIKEIKGGIS